MDSIEQEKLHTIHLRKYLKNMHIVSNPVVHGHVEHFSDLLLHEKFELIFYDLKWKSIQRNIKGQNFRPGWLIFD